MSTGVQAFSEMDRFPEYDGSEATLPDWMHSCARAGDALLVAIKGNSHTRSKNFDRATHYDEECRVGA